MTSISWIIRLCGVVALALIIFASLMLPAKWQQLRTGHWAVEHFLAYFAAASIVCLGWQHPFVVAGMLILLAGAGGLAKSATESPAQSSGRTQRSWRSVGGSAIGQFHSLSMELDA